MLRENSPSLLIITVPNSSWVQATSSDTVGFVLGYIRVASSPGL